MSLFGSGKQRGRTVMQRGVECRVNGPGSTIFAKDASNFQQGLHDSVKALLGSKIQWRRAAITGGHQYFYDRLGFLFCGQWGNGIFQGPNQALDHPGVIVLTGSIQWC